jgi:hypothetical protein
MGEGVGKVLDSEIKLSTHKIDLSIQISKDSEEIILIYIIEP